MSYTLEDVHEALALAVWHMPRLIIECTDAELMIHEALDAIEAQLPEPCEHCGSDSDWVTSQFINGEYRIPICMRCWHERHTPELGWGYGS